MRADIPIHPHERLDDLHLDGYHIIQDPKRFCFGVDAVILESHRNWVDNSPIKSLQVSAEYLKQHC